MTTAGEGAWSMRLDLLLPGSQETQMDAEIARRLADGAGLFSQVGLPF